MKTLDKKITELGNLQDNWDSYGAPTPSKKALDALKTIGFSAQTNGGVTVRIADEECELDVDIDENGRVNSFCFERFEASK